MVFTVAATLFGFSSHEENLGKYFQLIYLDVGAS